MAEKINYEKSIKRLEEITSILEKNEIDLDEMISLYAEGTKIVSQCSKALEEAHIKITKISKEGNNNE